MNKTAAEAFEELDVAYLNAIRYDYEDREFYLRAVGYLLKSVKNVLAARDSQGRGDLSALRGLIDAMRANMEVSAETAVFDSEHYRAQGAASALEAVLEAFDSHPQPSHWNYDMGQAPHGIKILVAYRNQSGKWRRVMAKYYGEGELESYEDEGYAEAGWYEYSENHTEQMLPVDGKIECWTELPPAPTLPNGEEQGA